MPLAFAKPLLMRSVAFTEKVFHLKHYSEVGTAYSIQQTICSLTALIIGLPKAHSDGVAYQDVKKPRNFIEKNAMSVFMLNALNYVSVSRAVCKVHLR